MREVFSVKRRNGYIELYFLGRFKGYFTSESEVEEEKRNILGC